MSAITDILLTHHLTLNADDETGGWHATCSCGADLGCCEDTGEGQKIQAAHVAHLIDPDDREYTPGQRREADRAMAAMSLGGQVRFFDREGRDLGSLLLHADRRALEDRAQIQGFGTGHVDHAGESELIEFLSDPSDGVFVQCLAGDTNLVRLTKTNSLDLTIGSGDADRRHGRTLESRQCLLHFERVQRGYQGDGETVSHADGVPHDDSSTGDGPAATGPTDSVEVTARRGDDSDPGELGDLAQAWRDVVTDYAAGRLQITVSSIDADTHWCRLHRLMQAHTKEAES
jgi:hypothetical protein